MSGELDLHETPEGTRLRLRVKPAARGDAIVGAHAGALKIQVTAQAEKGKANDAALALLCAVLRVPRSCLVLVAGPASRDKVVLVRLPRGTLEERLIPRLP